MVAMAHTGSIIKTAHTQQIRAIVSLHIINAYIQAVVSILNILWQGGKNKIKIKITCA